MGAGSLGLGEREGMVVRGLGRVLRLTREVEREFAKWSCVRGWY